MEQSWHPGALVRAGQWWLLPLVVSSGSSVALGSYEVPHAGPRVPSPSCSGLDLVLSSAKMLSSTPGE